MASSISWTDDDGAGSLTNGQITPGDRFANWTVHRKPIGPAVVGLGTGAIHRFEFRRDQTVTFSLAAIPESKMELMNRLQFHLLDGGTVTLAGDRAMASDFATAVIAPDTEPTIEQSDPQMREYTFSCILKTAVTE